MADLRLPAAAAALAVLAAARVTASLLPRRPPGHGVESITRSFGAFLPLFFVPALPVRCGPLGWGTAYLATAAALVLVTVAALRGMAPPATAPRLRRRARPWTTHSERPSARRSHRPGLPAARPGG